ncbi:MAG: hypothetical protein R3E65_08235 [Steroidobacteraceae bacterium]
MATYQPPDRNARLRLLWVVFCSVVLCTLTWVVTERWLESLQGMAPREAQRQLTWALRIVGVLLGVVVVAVGGYAIRLGARVRLHDRFPPPGVELVRRTIVLEGAQARARGRLLIGLGIALVPTGGLVALTVMWVAHMLGR